MKKFAIIALLFCLTSCYEMLAQEVKISPEISSPFITAFNSPNRVRVNVHDKRRDRYVIGKRGMLFGGEIKNHQSLQAIVGNKIMEGLGELGFGFGHDRIVDVFMLSLDYKVRNYLLKSDSFTNCVISVSVSDQRGFSRYRASYKGDASTSRYLLAPRARTNEKDINFALKMAIENILNDKGLIEALAR